jgi:anti-sigma-K factor RskA
MQDEEFRDLFHRMELRLERLDTKVENLEKGFADLRSEMRTRFSSIDTRLDGKAGNWLASLWGATLAMLIAAAFALTKWL